jgi:hypothetical protein
MNEKTVTISKTEYESLLEDSKWLQCLEGAGVDNWSGYDYARELWREENEKQHD